MEIIDILFLLQPFARFPPHHALNWVKHTGIQKQLNDAITKGDAVINSSPE